VESIAGMEPAMTPAVRVIGIDQPNRRAVNAPITVGSFGNGKYTCLRHIEIQAHGPVTQHNPLMKKITQDYTNLNNKQRRKIYYKGSRNTSKSMIGSSKVKKNDSLKVSSLNRRNKMSLRNHSMKRISGDEKKPKKLLPEAFKHDKRYHIKKEVGRGKQGIVYSAIDSKDNRKVAIKMITDDKDERERFKIEVKILEKIKKLGKDK
jgi:hypothetical protein